jgi:tetratricopeptide (TPR) repeat protein
MVRKIYFRFTTLLLVLSFYACTEKQQSPQLPQLLSRHELLYNGDEWDHIQNKYGSAKKRLNKNEDDIEAMLTLSQIFIHEARVTGEHGHYYPAALTILDRALTQKKINTDQKFLALCNKSGVLLSLHQFVSAEKIALEALQLNPLNAQVYGALVDANVELGQYTAAVKYADQMVKMRPDLRSYSRVAYLREIHGDMKGSEKALMMAIDAGAIGSEDRSWAMHTLGEMYINNNEFEKAKTVFTAILEERPHFPFAMASLADIAVKQKDYLSAERQYKDAIKIIPEVGFYSQLAYLYKSQGRMEETNTLKSEILTMLEDDAKSGHVMNLEYASLYLDLFDNPLKASEYIQKEYNARPKNKQVNALKSQIESQLQKGS